MIKLTSHLFFLSEQNHKPTFDLCFLSAIPEILFRSGSVLFGTECVHSQCHCHVLLRKAQKSLNLIL